MSKYQGSRILNKIEEQLREQSMKMTERSPLQIIKNKHERKRESKVRFSEKEEKARISNDSFAKSTSVDSEMLISNDLEIDSILKEVNEVIDKKQKKSMQDFSEDDQPIVQEKVRKKTVKKSKTAARKPRKT